MSPSRLPAIPPSVRRSSPAIPAAIASSLSSRLTAHTKRARGKAGARASTTAMNRGIRCTAKPSRLPGFR